MADTDDDILEEAKEAFAEAEEAESDNRERALASLKFGRMGEQWSDADKQARKDRPCLTINRMPSFVRQVVNDSRQNKPGIRVHPVDSSGDPDTAEVLNGLIRNIEVQSDAEVAYDTGIDNAASAGFGYLRVDLEPTFEESFDFDIKIKRVANPFSVYGDPNSIEADSSDWRTAFVTETLSLAAFKARYPDAKETIGWDGKDAEGWKNGDDIRVAEYWTRKEVEKPIALMSDGSVLEAEYVKKNLDLLQLQGINVVKERDAKFWKVMNYIITGAEVLDTVEWIGKYIPLIPIYGEEVNVEGKRELFSLIHWGMDPQRIYNFGRSASIETVALQPKAPFVGAVGQFDTDPRWATANSENHPNLEYDIVAGATSAPQRQPPPQPSSGWMAEVKVASDDMKAAIGMFNASMGERSNETSGKAIVERKIEGDISTFHFIDNLSRAIRHTGRVIVDLIPKVYDRPRMVRILGEDRKESRMVKVGPKPPTPPMPAPPQGGAGMPPAQAPTMAGPAPSMMPPEPPDPQAAAMSKVYDLTTGKYDVTVSAGPSFTSRREEAATQMLEMLRSFPALGPIIGDLVAKNLDWPGADEIADRIVKFQESQQQGQQSPKGPPPRDTLGEAQIKAGATVKAAEVKAKAGIVETQIKTQAEQQTEGTRIAAEQQAATQAAAASVMAGQRPPQLSPGGDIAR